MTRARATEPEAQLSLFRPIVRVRFRGVLGTVLDTWLDENADHLVQFDGPHEWSGPSDMASVAGCCVLVRVAECEVVT